MNIAELVPFTVGERVAFREDHDLGGNYGMVKQIGVTLEGNIEFDLQVYDPYVGHTGEEPMIVRATMEEIQ